MKILQVKAQNIRSIREEVSIQFHKDYSVLIGPNGGGKSNIIDILTIVTRQFLLTGYQLNVSKTSPQRYRVSQSAPITRKNSQLLQRFRGCETPSYVGVTVEVTKEDMDNIQMMCDSLESLRESLRRFELQSNITTIEKWNPSLVAEGERFEYVFDDKALDQGSMARSQSDLSSPEGMYRDYLNKLGFLSSIAQLGCQIELQPVFLYFSPYRNVNVAQMREGLSEEKFYQWRDQYNGATSRSTSSLIPLARHYYASKRRHLEGCARSAGFEEAWEAEPRVCLVRRYFERLGYKWDLRLIEEDTNVYDIILKTGNTEITLSEASSGEKELTNFLLGICSSDLRNGCILIDEPELHLHPKWQSLLLELLQDLQEKTGNQIILATHSPVFVTPETIGHVVRLYREGGATAAAALDEGKSGSARDLVHIINTHNNQTLFFADKVVLVEGITDRLVFSALIEAKRHGEEVKTAIEVLEVHGKHNFAKYQKLLAELQVRTFVVADLDYAREVGGSEVKTLWKEDLATVGQKVLGDKRSNDRRKLAECIEDAVKGGSLEKLQETWAYVKERTRKLKEPLNTEEQSKLETCIARQRGKNVFILRQGEIEDYLPKDSRSLDQVIELAGSEKLVEVMAELEHYDEISGIVEAIRTIA